MPAMGTVHRITTGASADRTQVQIPGTKPTFPHNFPVVQKSRVDVECNPHAPRFACDHSGAQENHLGLFRQDETRSGTALIPAIRHSVTAVSRPLPDR